MNVGSAFITIKPDTSKFRGELTRQLKPILVQAEKSLKGIKVDVQANTGYANRAIATLARNAKDLDRMKVTVTPAVDVAKGRAQLRALENQLRRLDGRTANVKVDVDADGAAVPAQMRGIVGRAERQGPAKLKVELDTRQALIGLGALALAAKKASDDGSALSGVLGEVKGFAVAAAIGPATSAITGLSGSLVGLVASLAPVTGLLPGLAVSASAVAQGFGVVKLATMGLADALKEADPTKQAEAFAKLPPAAASFGRALVALKPQVRALQESAAEGLFPGVERGLRAITPLFATLRPVVAATAKVMGDLAASLGELIASPYFTSVITRVGMANVGILRSLGDAARIALTPLAQIANTAVPLAERMGRLAESGARAFAAFIDGKAATGALARFFDEAWAASGRLFGVLVPLVKVLGGVGRAAKSTGDFILNGIGGSLDELSRKVNSAAGQSALRAYFEGFRPVLTEAGRLVVALGQAFGHFATSAGPGALAPLLAQLRTELLPALVNVSDTSAAILPKLVTLFAGLATAFSHIPLGPMLDGFMILVDVFNTVADHPIGEFFLKLALFIGNPTNKLLHLAAIVGRVGLAFGMLGGEMEKSGGVVASVSGFLTGTVLPAIAGFADFVSQQWANLSAWTREHWDAIQEAVGHVTSVVQQIIADFVSIVSAVWRMWGDELLNMVGIVWDQIRATIDAAVGIISGVISAGLAIINGEWGSAWDAIMGIQDTAMRYIGETIVNAMRFAREAVEGGLSAIVALAAALPGSMLNALGNLGGLLYNAGRQIMEGLGRGIRDAAEAVFNYVSSIAGRIADLKGPLDYDRRLLIPAGQAIMDSLVIGLRNREGELVRELAKVTGMVRSLDGAGHGNRNAGPNGYRQTEMNGFGQREDIYYPPGRPITHPAAPTGVSESGDPGGILSAIRAQTALLERMASHSHPIDLHIDGRKAGTALAEANSKTTTARSRR